MKTTVTTFKESGKFYDMFEVELPQHLEVWDKPGIAQYLESITNGCDRYNYIFTIDDIPHLVIHK